MNLCVWRDGKFTLPGMRDGKFTLPVMRDGKYTLPGVRDGKYILPVETPEDAWRILTSWRQH